MKSRLLCTILTLTLFITTLMPMASFAVNTDVDAPNYTKASDTLKRFDMLGDDYAEEEKLTFGDFLGLAMKLTGVASIQASTPSPYSDVSASEKYYNEVIAATNMGIVSGLGDGTLGYSDDIRIDRAVKILVSILGYDLQAMSKGGYPAGYTIIGGNLGIFENLSYDATKAITWGQAAQMVYNCLEIDILQPESYPAESYTTIKGETPLTQWMKINTVEGVVTGNIFTSTDAKDVTERGYVNIDGIRYAENGTGASMYIGCKVNAYYTEESSSKRTLLMVSLDNDANEWTISGEAIDDSTTKDKIYYYTNDSDKIKYVTVEPGANIFYNFKLYSGVVNDELFKPENGALRLIDSDGNKKADCVFVTESTTYVVEEVRAANGYIKDLYDRPDLRLDSGVNEDLIVEVFKDDVEVEFDEIKINDVLTVTQSEDGNYVKIEIGYKRAKGILSEIGENYLVINGRKYNILKQNAAEFDKSLLGKEITGLFDKYINASGYLISLSDDLAYGYLYDYKVGGTGLDAGTKGVVRIFTTNGECDTFELAAKVRFNGKIKNDVGEEYKPSALASELLEDGFIKHQLIRYKLNEDGKVSEIETARLNCADFGGTGMNEDGFTLDLDYDSTRNPQPAPHNYIYKNSGILGSDYDLVNATGIQIPNVDIWKGYKEGTFTMDDIEKTFSVYSPYASWANDTRFPAQSPTIRLYDVDDSKCARIIVTEGAGGATFPTAHLMLVESVVQAMDEDYNRGLMIKGIYKNQYVSYFVKEDATAFTDGELVYDKTPTKPTSGDEIYGDSSRLNLKSGDVIRIALDATNKIVDIFKVYSLEEQGEWMWDTQIEKGTSQIEINTIWANRKYLMGGSEFSEWTFQNGDTGMYNQVRFYNYCFWTGNSCQLIHARALYPNGERLVVDLGPIEDVGEGPALKLGGVGRETNYAFYDEATETVRVATNEDFIEDDRYTYIINNRYGVFNDIIVIKHKDPVTGYWQNYREGK